MTRHVQPLIALLSFAALAAGCGGGGDAAPTAPEPARTTLELHIGYIEVIEDCDGIEGDGDFEFDVWIYTSEATKDHIFSQTINLPPGGRTLELGFWSYTVDAVDGATIDVEFQAVELDKSISGEVYADERLAISLTGSQHRFSNGAWSNLGSRYLSLGGPGCLVRLYLEAGTP